MEMSIRTMTATDSDAVLRIFAAGFASGMASLEAEVPDWPSWDGSHLDRFRLVACNGNGSVVGWIAASPVSDRCAYAGVVENSVYVDPAARRQGIATDLLQRFIFETEVAGIWTIQCGIVAGNDASVALHERLGFRVVGLRERLGQHAGVWKDDLLLERRSAVVG